MIARKGEAETLHPNKLHEIAKKTGASVQQISVCIEVSDAAAVAAYHSGQFGGGVEDVCH